MIIIAPTLRVTPLRGVAQSKADAERQELHAHAEHGHDSVLPDTYCSSRVSSAHNHYRSNAPRHTSAPCRAIKIGRRASRTAFLRWSVRNDNLNCRAVDSTWHIHLESHLATASTERSVPNSCSSGCGSSGCARKAGYPNLRCRCASHPAAHRPPRTSSSVVHPPGSCATTRLVEPWC